MADVSLGSNEEILEFLKLRGYDNESLKKVKDSRVSKESIHLFSTQDFAFIGIALADARLLIEKYRSDRAGDLADIVAAVRGKQNYVQEFKKKKNKLKIKYGWHHWSSSKNSYIVVKLSSGGGVREKEWERETKLKLVFEDMIAMFFPNKRSSKGSSNLMTFYLYGADMTEIIDMDKSIDDFVKLTGLKMPNFLLMSKPLIFDEYSFVWISSQLLQG